MAPSKLEALFLLSVLLLALGCASDPVDDSPPEIAGTTALVDENPDPNVVEVHMTAARQPVKLDGWDYDMMTYNGGIPGPLLQAKVGDEIIVHFKNDLAEPTTIHWHGLRIPDEMDGTPRVQSPVQPGETFTYRFVAPDAGSFWYHPHVRAFEQVERGLYGPIVIHGENDPTYDLERFFLLDDIRIAATGTLTPFLEPSHEMHGRVGNELFTNGLLAAPVEAAAEQGQVERWRLVNTSNARTMEMSVSGARFRVIGTDGGLLAQPYETDRIEVAVGQRYDVEVSYDSAGMVELLTHVLTLDDQDNVVEIALAVGRIDVLPTAASARAIEWPLFEAELPRTITRAESLEFDAVIGDDDHIQWRLNGVAHREDPIFTFAKGDTARITLKNLLGPEHPFHLHGQFFKIIGRDEAGLKDTVLLSGGETVEIEAYMDNPGEWMAHCHILEHAELGMMTEIVVTE